MTSTSDSTNNGHRASRRVLLYLAARGFSPEESLALASQVLSQRPKGLAEAMEIVESILPPRPEPAYPPSFPPLNRRSMVTDKLANGDFFDDLEL
ncbi:MAG: hypothetical protein LBE01_02810 [Deltaproteobacteria bacterium]|nr:hypothetical protein [Deltaproteobacteria bacterium]